MRLQALYLLGQTAERVGGGHQRHGADELQLLLGHDLVERAGAWGVRSVRLVTGESIGFKADRKSRVYKTPYFGSSLNQLRHDLGREEPVRVLDAEQQRLDLREGGSV